MESSTLSSPPPNSTLKGSAFEVSEGLLKDCSVPLNTGQDPLDLQSDS
jgi:hypothetical protein